MSGIKFLGLLLVGLALVGCAHGQTRTLEGATWKATASGAEENGLRLLEGADGFTMPASRADSPCVTNKPNTQPPSTYLYFAIDNECKRTLPGPVYLVVEYFDDSVGVMLTAEYDSAKGDALSDKYCHADDRAGGWTLGLRQWRRAYFEFRRPRFANRQNCGADFRLSGPRLFIRRVQVTLTRPGDWSEVQTMPKVTIEPKVKIGPGGQLIIGGFDPARPEDVPHQTSALESAIPALKSLGVTSHEGYVRWNLCEPAEGKYDWSVYDAFVRIYKRHDIKWVPFLIVGSAYSLPDWYYKKAGFQGYVCLEHGEQSDVASLWSPTLKQHVARFIKAFCEHYREEGVIETILLGVTGNYGEAIYLATGNDWTADIHGPYHTHAGFWAGDPYAVASFQQWLQRKYTTVDRLSAAWGKTIASFESIRPFLKKEAPNARAWLDMCDWYIGSMTDWSRWWLQETRKHFPKGDIQLCTGGHAPAEHGSDFGEQCKVAAEIGGGVRITNEGSDYRANFSLTRWVASASHQYGARFSFEPAGAVDAHGVIARVYNATASGANGLHYYFPNIFGSEENRTNFETWGHEFQQRKPIVEIAVYYPETWIKLNDNDFLGKVQPLRDHFDFAYMSDGQILDGGLQRVKALILLHGNVSEAAVWRKIAEWVAAGGLVLYADGVGRLRTVEGDESWHDRILKPSGKGRALTFHGRGDGPEFRQFLSSTLANARELSPMTRQMVAADGVEDGVFVTLCAPDELLWLNYSDRPVTKLGKTLAPWSIAATVGRR